MPTRIRVTLVRSPIGLEKSQRQTAEGLGLRRLSHSRVHHNNPQIRGMIRKIAHLVAIEPVAEGAEA
jgi:large subunit ribosomal protein L30